MLIRNKLRLVIMLTVLILTGGCASVERGPESKFSAAELRDMGERFLAGGSHGQAIKYLTLSEQKDSKDPATQHALGRAYQDRGLPDQALEHYKRAVTLKPDFAEAHNSLGVFYAKQNEVFLAEDEFKKAIADPFNRRPHLAMFNLGLLYEGKGDTETALKYYQDALRLSPRYGMANYRMGLVLEEMRRADEARSAYARAIDSDPNLVEAHFRFGVMSYTAGELENAFYSLNRVLKLAPYSTLAAESKLYLNRLNSIIATQGAKSSQGHGRPQAAEVEVMTGKDVAERDTRPRQAVPENQFRVPPELRHMVPPTAAGQQQSSPPPPTTAPRESGGEKQAQPGSPTAATSPASGPPPQTGQAKEAVEVAKPAGLTEPLAAPQASKQAEAVEGPAADAKASELNGKSSPAEASNEAQAASGQQPAPDQPVAPDQPAPSSRSLAGSLSEETSNPGAQGQPGPATEAGSSVQPEMEPGAQPGAQPEERPEERPEAQSTTQAEGRPASRQEAGPLPPHEVQPGAATQPQPPEARSGGASQTAPPETRTGGSTESEAKPMDAPGSGSAATPPAESARSGTQPSATAQPQPPAGPASPGSSDALAHLPPPPHKPPPPQPVTPTDAATQMQTMESSAEPEPKPPGVADDTAAKQQAAQAESAPADSSGPAGGATYIVQVGSYLERSNAARLQEKLNRTGLDSVVKSYKHDVLGTLYVVQLKPMRDEEKAAIIMTQLEKQESLKAILIKVR